MHDTSIDVLYRANDKGKDVILRCLVVYFGDSGLCTENGDFISDSCLSEMLSKAKQVYA